MACTLYTGVVGALILVYCSLTIQAQLTAVQKQALIDRHNEHRGSVGAANMRRLEWNAELARRAREEANSCSFPSSHADRSDIIPEVSWVGSNRRASSELSDASLDATVDCWFNGAPNCTNQQRAQVLSASSHLIGCARSRRSCTSRAVTGYLLVCYYAPGQTDEVEPFRAGAPCTECPFGADMCLDGLCSLSERTTIPPDTREPTPSLNPTLYGRSPTRGSIAGGTELQITGRDFSSDPFSFMDPTRGNRVLMSRVVDGTALQVPCDVVDYSTNSQQIVCRTRASPNGEAGIFTITVFVDGNEVPNKLYFEYQANVSPTISEIVPFAFVPGEGEVVNVTGQIHTIRVADTQSDLDEEIAGTSNQFITRLLVGGENCNPFDENNEEYGGMMVSTSSTTGTVMCRPETNRIASMNGSIVLSEYGLGRTMLEDYALDNKLRPYLFQTHPDITRVEPSRGSMKGGTLITIHGKHFNDPLGDVKAFVGGVPCRVVNHTSTTIQCVTGPAPPTEEVYPGGRGIVREVWKTGYTFSDFALIQQRPYTYTNSSGTANVSIEERTYRTSFQPLLFNETTLINMRYSGFFVPPLTSLYTFNLLSDDASALYLSPNTSRAHKRLIAEGPQYTRNSWTHFSEQTSSPILLEAGSAYYIEAIHSQGFGPWAIGFGAKIHALNKTSRISFADHELQDIAISSKVVKEKQRLTVKAAPTIQAIELFKVNGSGNFAFQLQFGPNLSPNLTTPLDANHLTDVLKQLTSMDLTVNVEDTSDSVQLIVVFISASTDIPLLSVASSHGLARTEHRSLQSSNSSVFKVGFGSRTTSDISASATVEEVQDAITGLFATECEESGGRNFFYRNSYDTSTVNRANGAFDSSVEPYCGRFSLRRPTDIWRDTFVDIGDYSQTANLIVGSAASAGQYRYVCFAYIGTPNPLRLFIRNGPAIHIARDILFTRQTWTHVCIDMLQELQTYLNTNSTRFEVYRVRFNYHSVENVFWVDSLSISTTPVTVTRVTPAARPAGVFVNSVAVSRSSTTTLECAEVSNPLSCQLVLAWYSVKFTVHNCGFGMPLLNIVGNSTTVEVEQEAVGSPPVTGTFDLSFQGNTINNISVDVTNDRMKEILEEGFPDEGGFNVLRYGSCSGYRWRVEWTNKGGDQPLMTTNDSKVEGVNAAIRVNMIVDGGVYIRPFRGDMLRLPETSPQVEVLVDGIPASCRNRSCTFNFDESVTPQVTGFYPIMGGQNCDPITIFGSNFPADVSTSTVTVSIGDAKCNVTFANSSTIVCLPSQNTAGQFPINVQFPGVGNASSDTLFEYTAEVNSVTPSSGAIGGSIVIIEGVGFEEMEFPGDLTMEDFNIMSVVEQLRESQDSLFSERFNVFFDKTPCLVIRSNLTRIMCWALQHEIGVVDVSVGVGNQRVTMTDAYNYTNALSPVIHSVYPMEGPLSSGIVVTIRGDNFGTSMGRVYVGNAIGSVISQSNNEINFTTPFQRPSQYPITVHTSHGAALAFRASAINDDSITDPFNISDSGSGDSGSGDSFPFNDSANFFPFPPRPMYTYILEVTKVSPCSGSVLGGTEVTIEGSGFGESPSAIKVQFTNRLECHVTSVSGNMITCLTNGTGVPKINSSSVQVEVCVDGFQADYQLNITMQRELCPPCVMPSSSPMTDLPIFVYSSCQTPLVNNVSPSQVTLQANITIEGEMFGTDVSAVNVTFGGLHKCTPSFITMTTIVCQLDQSSQPLPFTSLLVQVHVNNLGLATVNSANNSITVNPVISAFLPATGSLLGGNQLMISGGPFTEADDPVVLVGNMPCTMPIITYDSIKCTLPASDSEQNLTIIVRHSESKMATCLAMGCIYRYSEASTPQVSSITPQTIGGGVDQIQIRGMMLNRTGIRVRAGPYMCSDITIISDEQIICDDFELPVTDTISKRQISSSDSPPAGRYEVEVFVPGLGIARLVNGTDTVTSILDIATLSPRSGSVAGGTLLTFTGHGFASTMTGNKVTIGSEECTVTASSYSSLTCCTPAQSEGQYTVTILVNGIQAEATYNYSSSQTPTLSTISPLDGQQGEEVAITGFGFGNTSTDVTVHIGGSPCAVTSSNETTVLCTLGPNLAGNYSVSISVSGKGKARRPIHYYYLLLYFLYLLIVNSISPTQGSFVGLNTLTVLGVGFNPTSISITICGQRCLPTDIPPNVTTVTCTIPSFIDLIDNATHTCDINVSSLGRTTVLSSAYTFIRDLTPMVTGVNRTRGGTGGGSVIEITGQGFNASVTVTIATAVCSVISYTETNIVCRTGPSTRTVEANIMVFVEGKGFAMSSTKFEYLDLWSSRFTWGGNDPPIAGDFVIVPQGQTLVLDVRTEVLRILLIQGGVVIFDDEEDGVELHSENIIITDGGRLQVGTEEVPYQHKARIVLYGHVLSTEIPLFGAKTLSVRNGTLDLHGKVIEPTWTRLASTAVAGNTTLELTEPVMGWEVGGKIVIASTSLSQRENEELEIAAISSDNRTLTLRTPLQYTHIAVTQVIDGQQITTSAEVGYLTRNIVVKGNTEETWITRVENCPDEFRPGQFERQTCFFGRFGAENIDDQFGSQIMLHRGPNDRVVGRIEYVEVTQAGQAFRLGRYPIHFHLNGDVNGSYVRGCGIHHTFNRAVTVHAVDHLLVEKNVAFNILGHAYFLEDGIEEGNIIQDNLGVFVRASSSLLNVDITPATFWVVNPNNIVRRNAAAGGTHFGFWYRLPEHPSGPSFTTSVFPRRLPLGEFSGNSAHSFGWYGLWIFPSYHPVSTSVCSEVQPAVFTDFFAWRNDRGVEFSEVGAVQLRNSIMLDNKLAGVEYTKVTAAWGENGALIKDVLVVARSALRGADHVPNYCTKAGIKTPASSYLTVSGVKFYNFDENECSALQACSHCRFMQGGFETRFSGLHFENSSNIAQWKWHSEQVFRDLDGTLTSIRGGALLPESPVLPTSHCSPHPGSNMGATNGSVCDNTLQFVRFALTEPVPSSLTFRDLNVTNDHGTISLIFVQKRLVFGSGPMAILPSGMMYNFEWDDGERFTNLSYRSQYSGMTNTTYLWVSHNLLQPVDVVTINGATRNSSKTIPVAGTAINGDWFSNFTNGTTVTYFVATDNTCPTSVPITFSTYKCFYPDCIPPPPPEPPTPVPAGRPNVTHLWSDTSIWPNGSLPKESEDVFINSSLYVIVDVALPKLGRLTITGGLELSDERDHEIQADLILILEQGRFIAGFPESPFRHKVDIILNGKLSTPEYRLPNLGPMVGSKAIGVLGQLILTGSTREPSWTFLESTVDVGENQLTLVENVDWKVGEEIVISSTSYEANQAEAFTITAVSNRVITINGTFMYRHLAGTTNTDCCPITIRAEVGLLSRSIRILSGDEKTAESEKFGCRVLVTNYDADNGIKYTGSAQLQGVEFKGCGQEGFVEAFDPRYSLAFLNTGTVVDNTSYVRHCSFHDGYNVGLGVFAADKMLVNDNVFHRTLGSSVVAAGDGYHFKHNLAVVAAFPGINEPFNSEWTANYELIDATNLLLTDNSAAGGAKSGYHTHGENCISSSFQAQWSGNIAHSTLHGTHMGFQDGHTSGSTAGCSAFNDFTIYSCYHYGIFSYGQAGILVTNAKLYNNYAAVFVIVIGPAALSHVKSNKEVSIVNSKIVASFDFDSCDNYFLKPTIANHRTSFVGLQTPSGGHSGVIISSFVSGRGHFPKSPWSDIISYPAIDGLTTIKNVTFSRFEEKCNATEAAIMTHRKSEDCQHPVYLEDITLNCVTHKAKFYHHMPILSSINPSDCVDMDCDGLKKILIKDMDGSFFNSSGLHTIVSMSELGWGERDPDRGVNDLRIPRTMLSNLDGTKKDPEVIYPNKGVFRGQDNCMWQRDWNVYSCKDVDHLMLVIESLDADTEVRRLSPIGLGVGNYVDLINGPQDHGWCGGYTCQERISTFYLIVTAGLEHTIAMTSTNPQDTRLQLLKTDSSKSILSTIFYTNPQRLDVYSGDEYVIPTNAFRDSEGNLNYNASGTGNFVPVVSDESGVNYYDRMSKKLYIVIKGDRVITIRTTPVVQVSLTVSVAVDDFFEKNLISNLAFLLDIPPNRIRVVSIISESSGRKRAVASTTVDFEIGDPPLAQVTVTPDGSNTTADNSTSYNNTTPTPPIDMANQTSFNELVNISTKMGEIIQTGVLAEKINSSIEGASVMQPEPPNIDPTGGVRAVNGTGGPQPGSPDAANLTTVSDQQKEEDLKKIEENEPIRLSIPSALKITRHPSGIIEGIKHTQVFEVTMFDNNNQRIRNLGVGRPWVLSASIIEGPSGALLANFDATIGNGTSYFHDLIFSHPGNYVLRFRIKYPADTGFSVKSGTVSVARRRLELAITSQPPSTANTSFALNPSTQVQLQDPMTNSVVSNHGWRGRMWFVDAVIIQEGSRQELSNQYRMQLVNGRAVFSGILIPRAGAYRIRFSVATSPETSSDVLPAPVFSEVINVRVIPLTRFIVTYPNDYNETVRGLEAEFIETLTPVLSRIHNSVRVYNLTVSPGSIIVSFFATSDNILDLESFVNTLTAEGGTNLLSFQFRGRQLNATAVVQDMNYQLNVPIIVKYLGVIIGSAVGGGLLVLLLVACVVFIFCCCCNKNTEDKYTTTLDVEMRDYDNIYSNAPTISDYDSKFPVYHLTTESPGAPIMVAKEQDGGDKAFPIKDGIEYVVSKEVKVGEKGEMPGRSFEMPFGGGSDKELLMKFRNNNNNNNNIITQL